MAVKKDPRLAVPIEGSLGAHLRKAREEANMTVDKVAATLLLHPNIVVALEADAYDRLPAPTFVRGYLRGYARVLGLPSRPILEMYDRQGYEPPPLSPDVTEPQQAHTSDTAVRLVTYAVAAVLVLLVGLWWHSQEDGGFGISGDLFDRSPESDRDPSLPADEESGTVAAGGDADGESIATTPDGPDALQPGIEPFTAPPATDPASGAEEEDATVATESIEPNESSPNEEPVLTLLAGAPASDDAASTDAAPADAAPADAAAGDETGVATRSEPTRNDESAATAPVEESAPGRMDTVVAAPAEAADPGATEERETSATRDSTAGIGAEAGVDSEADSIAGADVGTGTSTSDTDGEDARGPEGTAGVETAGVSPGTSSAGAPASDSTEASESSGAAPAAGSETAPSGLVLEFVHESWVEVYDSERTRLFFGLVPPGRMLSFDGARPFDVLLGYGKDVRVAIDGRAFDHTPYLKHGVARFSVGARAEVGTGAADSAGVTAADTGVAEPAGTTASDTGGTGPTDTAASDTGGTGPTGTAASDTGGSPAPRPPPEARGN